MKTILVSTVIPTDKVILTGCKEIMFHSFIIHCLEKFFDIPSCRNLCTITEGRFFLGKFFNKTLVVHFETLFANFGKSSQVCLK